MQKMWRLHMCEHESAAALIAVGGYGRGELHPASDVDVLVVLDDVGDAALDDAAGRFVTLLWDVGLEIGHSVRTLAQCEDAALGDLSVATSMMEARYIAGNAELFDAMQALLDVNRMWPSADFYRAKREEQIARHRRFHDTAYNLEPNVKSSPGGLRDIQVIAWVAKRHFGATTLSELVDHKFLTNGQLRRLKNGEQFLWRIRFALHLLTSRREDRLLFDHQTNLAAMLGYEDAAYTLAVEQMMQRYYRTVMDLSRLNEMLLQQFEEAILMDPAAPPKALNGRFVVKNGYLQSANEDVFADEPSALLEVFLLLQQNPQLKGVSAYTVGSIKRHLHRIDDEFRQNPRNHRLFLEILRAPEGVTHELRRMNRYGVLGLYIPAFGRIVGRMQYDLFHAYTVDEHTLFVVSNLRRFALTRFDDEFPHCSEIMRAIDDPIIVYLGGLFHDIAKGRGGDHSELGAVDAESFCLEHGMSTAAAETVAWLVRHHLILSTTAQKKDLGDPDVINAFAELVGSEARLNYLYLLTVADVRGTNPKLWNSWKAQLFRDLYELAKQALRRGLENPVEGVELAGDKKSKARNLLSNSGLTNEDIAEVWDMFHDEYFMRHRGAEIAWHTQWLADAGSHYEPGLVDVRRRSSGDGVEAALLSRQVQRTFAHATAVLDELGLTIVDARIVPLPNGYSIDTFVFMEQDPNIDIDDLRIDKIATALMRMLAASDEPVTPVTRPVARKARMFTTRTQVHFSRSESDDQTVLELIAADRPGLLSFVGQAFIEHEIDIASAKIMTIGERAEDVFYISDENGKPLTAIAQDQLRDALIERLDQKK